MLFFKGDKRGKCMAAVDGRHLALLMSHVGGSTAKEITYVNYRVDA